MDSPNLKSHLNSISIKQIKTLIRQYNLHYKIKLSQNKPDLISDLLKHFETDTIDNKMISKKNDMEIPKIEELKPKTKIKKVIKEVVKEVVKPIIEEKPIKKSKYNIGEVVQNKDSLSAPISVILKINNGEYTLGPLSLYVDSMNEVNTLYMSRYKKTDFVKAKASQLTKKLHLSDLIHGPGYFERPTKFNSNSGYRFEYFNTPEEIKNNIQTLKEIERADK